VIFEYSLIIKEHHLDSYGHVNNATYLALFEEARWEAITGRGYGYKQVHETGLGPVVLEVGLKFLKELKLREKIIITLEVESYEGKIFRLRQKMIKQDGEIAADAVFTGAFFDLKNRKLIPQNAEWLKAIGFNS